MASPATSPSRPPIARAAARFALYLAACWGVLLALAWGAVPGRPGLGALAVALAAAYTTAPLVAFLAGGGGWRRYPTAAFRLWVVRPTLYGQLLLPIVAAAALVGLLAAAPFGHAVAGGRVGALAALAVGGAVLAAGWLGSRRLVVREVEARVPGLDPAFDGLRVVQLSDLHLGPQTSRRFLARVARTVRALRPDLIVATGDLVDDRAEDVAPLARWLDTLDAEGDDAPPLGTWLIPGNHDVYAGWSAVEAGLRRASRAHLLVNDAHLLRRGVGVLALVGTGDPAGRGRGPLAAGGAAPDIPRALARVPAGVPVLAFAHNPALWPALAGRGVALTLNGHTHWGQLALPRLGWSLASPFLEHAMGAYQEGEALLYVHPGTGFWGIPFRLGAFPEVAVVTLRASARAGIAMGAARAA